MIAPNDRQPSRNDPCPCGSGLKHKHCCLNPQVKALRRDNIRLTTMAHLFLTELQKLTGKNAVIVPREILARYPPDARISMAQDHVTGAFRFWVEPPPEKPVIQPLRRIILPQS
jgi:hypothetical protein